MSESISEILSGIESAEPANEAEVETKILLHIFRLLGFRDPDRADKPSVTMHFGLETKQKEPDFILYDGPERSLTNALVAVEAKSISNSIEKARDQARSYALWAGTPFYVVCNGVTILAVQFIPAGGDDRTLEIKVKEISVRWLELYAFLNRAEVIIAKERLAYLSCYLPQIESLPASEFFKEYLSRLSARFSLLSESTKELVMDASHQDALPSIPVTATLLTGTGPIDLDETRLANHLLTPECRLFIEGLPGSGKSTLCKRVVNHLSTAGLQPNADLLPIYIPLARFIPDSVSQALTYACREMGVRVFPSLFGQSLTHVRIVLVLDGLDEVDLHDRSRLRRLLDRERKCNLVITSRPLGIKNNFEEDDDFAFARIRNLTESELWAVLMEYLGSETEVLAFLENTNPALRRSLHSPLFALMAIRIAQTRPQWHSLSTFELFRKYVLTLHRFFNDVAVRGKAGAASEDSVFSALAEVAHRVQSLGAAEGIPLNILADSMGEIGKALGFDALINIGLVSSAGGRAVFFHQVFQEFGIALWLLDCIRSNDVEGFVACELSELAYQLVSGDINPQDEARLICWLSDDNKFVRRRVLRILRYGSVSSNALDLIKSRLKNEPSIEVWSASVHALIAHNDERFLEDIFSLPAQLSPRKQRILAWAIRSSDFPGYLPWAIRLAEEQKQHAVTACAFEVSLRANAVSEADRLVDLYLRETPSQRRKLCRLLNEYRDRPMAQILSNLLFPLEGSAAPLIYLLSRIKTQLKDTPESQLIRACAILAGARNLRSKDRRRLRSIAVSLKGAEALSDSHQDLLSVCESLGRYKQQ